MRDRSRQFADCRMAVEVYKLHQALTRFDFGETAAMPFMQQSADQRSLDQDYDRNQRGLPTVFFPGAELTKQDFASWRQVALADAPALHLPPIVFRRRKSYWLHLDIARLLATEDADRGIGGLPAGFIDRMHRAADGISAEKRFLEGKDRGVRDRMEMAQGEITFMGDTCRVDRHQAPEQDRVRWKRRRPLQDFLK